jgi:hypothetical protein
MCLASQVEEGQSVLVFRADAPEELRRAFDEMDLCDLHDFLTAWNWTASDEAFAGAQSSCQVRGRNDLSDAAGYLLGLALLLERRLDGGEE